jgi:hypothetical protein
MNWWYDQLCDLNETLTALLEGTGVFISPLGPHRSSSCTEAEEPALAFVEREALEDLAWE